MTQPITGIHHVTAIASNPQRNLDFYTEVLGLRLVKKTVNFDDPGTYHLYFGDDAGSPGTILTFFPWPDAYGGTPGIGETRITSFSAPEGSLDYWEKRLLDAGLPAERTEGFAGEPTLLFPDPDGMKLEIVPHPGATAAKPSRFAMVPAEAALRGFYGVMLAERALEPTADVLSTMGYRKVGEDGRRVRFAVEGEAFGHHVDLLVVPQGNHGRLGAGSVHHIAFRMADDASQLEWREKLVEAGLSPTQVLDRNYFHSVYFREPGGVLFELATDPPGFAVDEAPEALGEALKLPEWLESQRSKIETVLPALELHRSGREAAPKTAAVQK